MSNSEQPKNIIFHDFSEEKDGVSGVDISGLNIIEVDFSREGKGTVFVESLNDFKLSKKWENIIKRSEINSIKSWIVEIYLYIKDLEEIYSQLSQLQSIPLSEFDRLTKKIRSISSMAQDVFDRLSPKISLLKKLINEKERKSSLAEVCIFLGEKFNSTIRNVSTKIDVLDARRGELP